MEYNWIVRRVNIASGVVEDYGRMTYRSAVSKFAAIVIEYGKHGFDMSDIPGGIVVYNKNTGKPSVRIVVMTGEEAAEADARAKGEAAPEYAPINEHDKVDPWVRIN